MILAKFVELNNMENHFMNQEWNKVLKYWSTVIEYIVQETGSASQKCFAVLFMVNLYRIQIMKIFLHKININNNDNLLELKV